MSETAAYKRYEEESEYPFGGVLSGATLQYSPTTLNTWSNG